MALAPGFAAPVTDAAHAFRAILHAMSRPGTIVTVGDGLEPPAPFGRAAAAVLLTLADHDAAVWLHDDAGDDARRFLAFHTGAPVARSRAEAAFAWLPDPAAALPLDGWALGEAAYPDRSTTLVIEVPLLEDDGAVLAGPGIDGAIQLEAGLPDAFLIERAALRPLHPLGLDLILTCGDRLAALPRTTSVRATEMEAA